MYTEKSLINGEEITPDSILTRSYVNAEESFDSHIVALCADFARRERVIKERSASYRVLMTYKFLNFRMLEAAVEVAGTRDAKIFIKEIGERTGYANTETTLSESTYKLRKLGVKIAISRKLALLDFSEK